MTRVPLSARFHRGKGACSQQDSNAMTRPPNHQRTCDGYHSGQNVFRFPFSFCKWFAANLLDKTRHSRSQLKMHLRFGYMCDAVETHK